MSVKHARVRGGRTLRAFGVVVAVSLACASETGDASPPIDLIVSNVETTDLTVMLEITDVDTVATEGAYTTWQFGATVRRVFKGDLAAGAHIEYTRTMETGVPVPQPGSRHLVSFVREDTRLVLPDVGYHFPYTEDLGQRLTARLGHGN